MARFRKILAASALLATLFSLPAAALSYDGYIYDGWQQPVPSQIGYEPVRTVTAKDFGTGVLDMYGGRGGQHLCPGYRQRPPADPGYGLQAAGGADPISLEGGAHHPQRPGRGVCQQGRASLHSRYRQRADPGLRQGG